MVLRNDRSFRHPSEGAALLYLEGMGHRLIAHNYHVRMAEIDLITLEPEEPALHFTEVKSWSGAEFRHPLESLYAKKRNRMRYGARRFLMEWRGEPCGLHFDLIWIHGDGSMERFPDIF